MAHPFGGTSHIGSVDYIEKDAVEIRVGSDSDIPKIQPLIDILKEKNIPYILRILSAHRTPERMTHAAQSFPEIDFEGIPEEIEKALAQVMGKTQLCIRLCIAAAGGSAHIAGMTASETHFPVIALPVSSSAMGTFDSTFSMLDMPPGIPNGFSLRHEDIANISEAIIHLTEEDTHKIFVYGPITGQMQQLAQENGIEFTTDPSEAKLGIYTVDVGYHFTEGENSQKPNMSIPIPIIIPCLSSQANSDTIGKIHDVLGEMPGLIMGLQKTGSINGINALLYALEIFAPQRPDIMQYLKEYRQKLKDEVQAKDAKFLAQSLIEQFTVTSISLPSRYNLGNPLFHHSGKVRETVVNPDNPNQRIMIATDRISTHDVIHTTGVPGKGEALTSISNYWFSVLGKEQTTGDIPTQVISNPVWPADFPEELRSRSIIVESLTPFKVEAVMRKYLTGSGLKAWNIHLDLEILRREVFDFDGRSIKVQEEHYKSQFPNAVFDDFQKDILDGEWKWEQEPEYDETALDEKGRVKDGAQLKTSIFTPTTKDVKDTPITLAQMKESIVAQLTDAFKNSKTPEEIQELIENAYIKIQDYTQRIFAVGSKHLDEKGFILADTKFEFAFNARGEIVLIDEVMTPDSSRMWTKSVYADTGKMEAHDKQPVRDDAMKQWKQMGQTKQKPPLSFAYTVVLETVNRYKKMKELFV